MRKRGAFDSFSSVGTEGKLSGMKRTYVQCVELLLKPGADAAAPGGAVTLALCGSWDHAGACRWPHETTAAWDERRGRVRVVFAADAEEENQVRALIDQALAGG